MNEKNSNNKKIFFIVLTVLSFFIGGPIVGIIVLLARLKYLEKQGKEETGKNTQTYYNIPSVSKTTRRRDPVRTEEQKQKDKWARRGDKDPWEWDE